MSSHRQRPRLPISDRRVFLFAVLALAVFLACDSFNRLTFIRVASAVKTSETAPGSVPIANGARERLNVLPVGSIDGKWWVMDAEEAWRTGQMRIRDTQLDNAPEGREKHWSSGLMRLLVLLASGTRALTGWSLTRSMESAALLAGPVMFVLAIFSLALLAVRHFGWLPAAAQILMLGTSFTFFEMFRAGEADHHGIVAFFSLLSVVGVVIGAQAAVSRERSPGAGKGKASRRRNDPVGSSAQFWFASSGLAGAAGLWVSAATQIPVLVGCGLGALGVAWSGARVDLKGPIDPTLWRTWGIYGCLGSVAFYLLEYFPSHMGWRLEVNHPLYALAWLGGGDLLCRLTRVLGGGSFSGGRKIGFALAALALLGTVLPAAAIYLHGKDVFWVSDRFLLDLHNSYIREFQSIVAALRNPQTRILGATFLVWPILLTLTAGWLLGVSGIKPQWRPALVFALCPAAIMQALAFYQVRWSGPATALWSVVLLLIVFIWIEVAMLRPAPKWAVPAFLGIGALAVLYHPVATGAATFSLARARLVGAEEVPTDVGPSILARDVAHRLVQYRADRLPVVLCGPTTSSELSYYGGIRTIGTLYWENLPGLKKAARMFAASSDDKLKAKIEEAGVTHIVIFSWDDFAERYIGLLSRAGEVARPEKSALDELIKGTRPPARWLRPLYYPIPEGFGLLGQSVRILEVRPEQTPFEWYFHRGIFHSDAREYSEALRMFAQALILDPQHPKAAQGFVNAAVAGGDRGLADTALGSLPDSLKAKLAQALAGRIQEQAPIAPPKP